MLSLTHLVVKDYSSLIVNNGTNANRKVYAKHSDLRAREPKPEEISLPTSEEESEAALRTSRAIQSLLNPKNAMSNQLDKL